MVLYEAEGAFIPIAPVLLASGGGRELGVARAISLSTNTPLYP